MAWMINGCVSFPSSSNDAHVLVDYNIQNELDLDLLDDVKSILVIQTNKQNFVNTLIIFLRTVHSFLSNTLDEQLEDRSNY